ncbi:MAG: SPFH domain-containing protein [Promethearchaeota archaeon]
MKDKKFFAVKDYERALFYNKGELIGVLKGGIYEIDRTDRVKGTEIVFIDMYLISIPWGIPKKYGIITRDGVKIGMFGDMKLRIRGCKTFYNDIVAGKKIWCVIDLRDWINTLLHTSLRDIFKEYNIFSILLEDRERIINLITSKISNEFLMYGLEIESFNVIDIKVPEDIENLLTFNKEKFKTKILLKQNDIDNLIQEKTEIQIYLKELKDSKMELQNKLLHDKITLEEYNKKKKQVEIFINEAFEELKKIEELLSRL